MLDFNIGSLVVRIHGSREVYKINKILELTDEVEIIRFVDGDPRWSVLKCWEVRLANHLECGKGLRLGGV